MGIKNLKTFLHISILSAILLFSRCAQVLPLTGGDKDVSSPKLLKAIPENASVNFNTRAIEFTFNEFIQVKDINNQLVITPQINKLPLVEARGKKLTVTFDENLLPNTTYRLFFGNSVSDMHESNVLSGFEYVFSTGSQIDSNKLQGVVNSAFNLKPQADVIVGLYPAKDSITALLSRKPVYLTKTDNAGRFRLSYLPDSKYRLIAYSDKNKNLLYDGPDESIGFHSETVITGVDTFVNVRLFAEEVTKLFIKKAHSPYYGLAYIVYNKEQENEVTPYYNKEKGLIYASNVKNDTCKVYYHAIYDTLRLLVKHPGIKQTDTVSISVQSKEKNATMIREKKAIIDLEVGNLYSGKLDYFKPLALIFNNWVDVGRINEQKIILMQKMDSGTKQIPVTVSGIMANGFKLLEKTEPATEYQLTVMKDAIKDLSGVGNDSIRISFKTTDPEDYASLTLKLQFPKKENYIVQILNAEGRVLAEHYCESSIASSTEKSILFKNLSPGNYFVKVIEDADKNKKWETGSILAQKQPELIYFNPVAIKLLANWDSESEWIVK